MRQRNKTYKRKTYKRKSYKRKTYKRKNKRSKRIKKSRRSFIKKTRTKKSKNKRMVGGSTFETDDDGKGKIREIIKDISNIQASEVDSEGLGENPEPLTPENRGASIDDGSLDAFVQDTGGGAGSVRSMASPSIHSLIGSIVSVPSINATTGQPAATASGKPPPFDPVSEDWPPDWDQPWE